MAFDRLKFFRILVLVLYGVVLIRTAWLSDDGFITYRTIDNFLNGYGMRWNISERVQAYTHPLWMLLLVVPHALTGEAFWSTHLVSIGISLSTMGIMLWKIAKTPAQVLTIAVGVLFCNAYIDFSTSGLENPLTHLLIVSLFIYVTRHGRNANPGVLGLFLSLFILNRQDLLLIALPPILLCVDWKRYNRRSLIHIAAGIAPIILWEIFSMVYYGFPVPNTAYAKLGGEIPRSTSLSMGLDFILASFQYDPLCLVTIGTGVTLTFLKAPPRMKAFALGSLLYTVYIVWAGGDFMAGRFLSGPFLVSLLLIVDRLAAVRIAYGVVPWSFACAGIGLFCTPTPAFTTGLEYSQKTEKFPWTNGVCSERAYYYPYTSLLRNLFGDELGRQSWVQYGKEVRATATRTVHVYGAIGFRGYFGGPDLHIIDYNALCDPLLARLPTVYPAERPGHLKRTVPAGYKRTHETGVNHIEDPRLAQYYDELRTVVAGPLFGVARMKAIIAMNLRVHDGLIDKHFFKYPDAVNTTLEKLPETALRGVTWNKQGNTVMRQGGVFVDLGAPRHEAQIEVSLDHNDRYRIRFLKQGAAIGELELGPSRAIRRGMEIYTEAVPSGAVESGYDQLHLVPMDGDEKFSLGHVRLFDLAQ